MEGCLCRAATRLSPEGGAEVICPLCTSLQGWSRPCNTGQVIHGQNRPLPLTQGLKVEKIGLEMASLPKCISAKMLYCVQHNEEQYFSIKHHKNLSLNVITRWVLDGLLMRVILLSQTAAGQNLEYVDTEFPIVTYF